MVIDMMEQEKLRKIFMEAANRYGCYPEHLLVMFDDYKIPNVNWDNIGGTYNVHVSDYFMNADEDLIIDIADCTAHNRFIEPYRTIRWTDKIRDYLLNDSFIEDNRPVYLAREELDTKPRMTSDSSVMIDPNSSLRRLVKSGVLDEKDADDMIVVWDNDLWSNPIALSSPVMKTIRLSRMFVKETIPFNVRDYIVYAMACTIILGRKDPAFSIFNIEDELRDMIHRYKGWQVVERYLDMNRCSW